MRFIRLEIRGTIVDMYTLVMLPAVRWPELVLRVSQCAAKVQYRLYAGGLHACLAAAAAAVTVLHMLLVVLLIVVFLALVVARHGY